MAHQPEPDATQKPCAVCSSLSDQQKAYQKYGWEQDNTQLPSAASRLSVVRDFAPYSSRKKQLHQCPECGTCYLYTTNYEFLVNGSEDEECLTRLTPQQAAEYLSRFMDDDAFDSRAD